jgi:hypothetical protein
MADLGDGTRRHDVTGGSVHKLHDPGRDDPHAATNLRCHTTEEN